MFKNFCFKPLYCDDAVHNKMKTATLPNTENATEHEKKSLKIEHPEELATEVVTAPETENETPNEPEEDPELAERRALMVGTPGFDARFPNTNQARNCWQNYVDYFRCVDSKGEDYEPCQQFKKVYQSLCPIIWVDSWDEQREGNVFPGLAPGRWKQMPSKH